MLLLDLQELNLNKGVRVYLFGDLSTEILWDGLIDELPYDYLHCKVCGTAQSIGDLNRGIISHYVYIKIAS